MSKVALFACSGICIPTLQLLMQEQRLGCVVLSPRQDNDYLQLAHTIQHHQIPHVIYQTDQLEQTQMALKEHGCNLGLLVSFNKILPESIINLFEGRLFNFHPSALPKYRGANPLFWQIYHGEKDTKISAHQITNQVDQGGILCQSTLNISNHQTFGGLLKEVANQTAQLVRETLEKCNNRDVLSNLTAQSGEVSHAPHPTDAQRTINWKTMTGAEIERLCRACNPTYGGAITYLHSSPIYLLNVEPVAESNFGLPPGTVIKINQRDGLLVASNEQAIKVNILQSADGILSGYQFAELVNLDVGQRLTEAPMSF